MPVALPMTTATPAKGVFSDKLRSAALDLFPLRARELTTLQINVGKRCNQACKHCHVDAGPHRTEEMSGEMAALVVDVLRRHPSLATLDITGGAPELNPHFEWLVREARSLNRHVIDRCNLTILSVLGKEHLADFLAENRVEVVASLPYYLAQRTDAQRGQGVFDQSIAGLRRLNELGYGRPGTGLILNLVYNPTGAFLPPDQAAMEAEYKAELGKRHDLVFNHLFTITNLPIARFKHFLERTGNYARYMDKLAGAFNPQAAANVMCRSLLSVGYDGFLYDCDFNQMLDLPVRNAHGRPIHLTDFDELALSRREIVIGDHCLGCTAGAGSSCGGAVAA